MQNDTRIKNITLPKITPEFLSDLVGKVNNHKKKVFDEMDWEIDHHLTRDDLLFTLSVFYKEITQINKSTSQQIEK